jgi:hypothetical protein
MRGKRRTDLPAGAVLPSGNDTSHITGGVDMLPDGNSMRVFWSHRHPWR